jgi:hypothetical protein
MISLSILVASACSCQTSAPFIVCARTFDDLQRLLLPLRWHDVGVSCAFQDTRPSRKILLCSFLLCSSWGPGGCEVLVIMLMDLMTRSGSHLSGCIGLLPLSKLSVILTTVGFWGSQSPGAEADGLDDLLGQSLVWIFWSPCAEQMCAR